MKMFSQHIALMKTLTHVTAVQIGDFLFLVNKKLDEGYQLYGDIQHREYKYIAWLVK